MTTHGYPPPIDPEEQAARNQALIKLLDSWMNVSEEEAQEQRETFEALKKGMDEHRPPGYKLFE
jgi:hypothetical protein